MSVFKKNGNWWIDIYLNGRRVRRKIGPDKRTAQLVEKDLKVKDAKGEWLGIKPKKRITFGAFYLKIYLPRRAKNADSTLIGYKYTFRLHLQPVFGDQLLDQIRVGEVEDYLAARLSEAKSSTVSKERSILKAVFNAAVRWGYLQKSPAQHLPPIKAPEPEFNIPTEEQVAALYDAARKDSWFYTFVAIALNTGMRREEMRCLEWDDIDLKRRWIRISSDEGFTTKSRKNRYVPINDFLAGVLQRHPRHITKPYVFPGTRGDSIIGRTVITRAMHRALKAADLPRIRVHDLRHAFGTGLAENGVDPKTIMELMGHSDLQMTMRYLHTSDEKKKDAVAKLSYDGLISSPNGQDLDTGRKARRA